MPWPFRGGRLLPEERGHWRGPCEGVFFECERPRSAANAGGAPARFELMPEVSTLSELGLAGPALSSHRYICLPHDVPKPLRDQLQEGLSKALLRFEHIERMNMVGLPPGRSTA